MFDIIGWSTLDAPGKAAWVQAYGSIAAILVAVAVPLIAAACSALKQKARDREKMLNAGLRILDPISSLRVSVEEFYRQNYPSSEGDSGLSADPHDGDFQSLIPGVVASVSVLDDMGPLAPALRMLLFELIELDRTLKMIPVLQRSGYPSAWINNIDYIREKAKGVMDGADAVITGLQKEMKAR